MRSILEPFMLGELALPNRVVMGPMTRARAPDDGVPTAVMAEYYAQRASAGLIITEGVFPDLVGKGYFATPGIETQAQTEGWKRVAAAVHARGGRIVMQLMHCGRVGHQANNPGVTSVSPSGVPSAAVIFTRAHGMQTHSSSRALDTQEVVDVLDKFERAAGNAKAAGFDGIELHAAPTL